MSKLGDGAKDIFSRGSIDRQKEVETSRGYAGGEHFDETQKNMEQRHSETRDDSPRKAGRPKVHKVEVLKTVITLRKDQLIWLDQLALNIRSASDTIIDRGCLIRAFISFVMESGIDFSNIENEEEAKDIIIEKMKGK